MIKTESLKQTITSIPEKPGIYKMYDKNNNLLYIGKSKSLKSRVRSYFYGKHKQSKINILVNNIDHIETIITDTHLEAQILECALIKKLKPIYNSQFKNHDKYAYLKVEMVNRYNSPLSLVYKSIDDYTIGPFKNRRIIRNIITLLQNIYPIKIQDNTYSFEYSLIPRELREEDFQENAINLFQILSEDKSRRAFIGVCENKMIHASSNLDYNTAIVYRDTINSLEYIDRIKNNLNSYNYPHLIVGERIEYGYKLFFISHNLIILKRKYSQIDEENIISFIEYGKKLNEINIQSNEKRNLDFKGIVSSDLRDKEFKQISAIDNNFTASEFIQALLDIEDR